MSIWSKIGTKIQKKQEAKAAAKAALPMERQDLQTQQAMLTRENVEYQRNILKPRRDLAAARVLDPAASTQALNQSIDVSTRAVDDSFDAAEGRLAMAYSRGNSVIGGRQKEAFDRSSAAARAAARADAGNKASTFNRETELELLVGR